MLHTSPGALHLVHMRVCADWDLTANFVQTAAPQAWGLVGVVAFVSELLGHPGHGRSPALHLVHEVEEIWKLSRMTSQDAKQLPRPSTVSVMVHNS
jgi:hypothetical protein